MRLTGIQRIGGILIVLSSLTMLPPAAVSWLYGDGAVAPFLEGSLLLAAIGAALWWPVRHQRQDLRIRDGFIIVVACWFVLGLSGAVPLLLSPVPAMTVPDAVFESISGLTTTGATVLTGIDALPHGILFYRHQLQWLGGMGIVVLAVAVLPMLRIGGMQLYRAETPGPMKDNKLTPRITETAKALWYLYLGLTFLCAAAYWLAGMSLFDAICHAFSTIAIGGFSTHDASIAFFDSRAVELIAILFMVIAGMNFALHFLAWRGASTTPYTADPELRAYLFILLVGVVLCTAGLLQAGLYDVGGALRYGLFQVVSVATTTGFTTANFYDWPNALPLLLLLLSCIGACAGSTGGGIKVIRGLLLYRQGVREITRLVHPSVVNPVKLGRKTMSEKVIQSVWGFFSLYVAMLCLLSLGLTALGLDLETAVSAVLACLNNLGPALGAAGPSYASLDDPAKLILAFAMIMGRLELFTLLVIMAPVFWRD